MDAEETLQGIRKSYAQSCFLGGTVAKNLLANAGDTRDVSLIPRSGRSPGVGKQTKYVYIYIYIYIHTHTHTLEIYMYIHGKIM